ncbi:hypothetical protein C4577_04240 [Candidatus Parcubacteria bacterium]|nr:MAG: hypothetical protein C4577_04240 [Candidatus Parcubacteria bacterium]
MSKITFYYQCYLEKSIDVGFVSQMSFIPEEFAKKGMLLKLKEDDGSWNNGWRVREVYGEGVTWEELKLREWRLGDLN